MALLQTHPTQRHKSGGRDSHEVETPIILEVTWCIATCDHVTLLPVTLHTVPST